MPMLVGGLELVLFFHTLGIVIPIDFHIFQRGRSTTNQNVSISNKSVIMVTSVTSMAISRQNSPPERLIVLIVAVATGAGSIPHG